MNQPDTATVKPDLFYDLQQFLYDARDQFQSLEQIRGDMGAMVETTRQQEDHLRKTFVALQLQIQKGARIHLDAGLAPSIQALEKTARHFTTLASDQTRRWKMFIAIAAVSTAVSALIGALLGVYIAVTIL
ncbi:hypothetical protein [Pseudosulfitobacter pseudonitzschiae]|uniref:hypothetical protein n=1 Tax=Pseudosulfitobacter pseudonitzschiae TaxID=1402135 RepID=UPI001AF5AB09|nr:hypothetical protein [Pseudosulfitobacter pseudonitzschiae]MBM1817405.1 hypothetical protein [Pseudosulfitobacter pseudonitzschiae]MBM1834603.1 hypothetical protein [Pseudosulfitobacter pseudonitzschiae]MBM1839467.1 hypothetical protein [Pseudosulfitobacter pseudonitzschiae]MBM1844318.1 hypothetical protein [Pseudosulfitobacter pseudonitzschiae]MBM1849152.1 hypothetical protein [Pseudosulfitobacter pseudonitzschiae]